MIVRHMDEVRGSEREVFAPNGNWVSRRMLLAGEGMGFSFHETIIFAGTETHICYKHHYEAVYCVAGHGEIESLAEKRVYPITPGTMYALNEHDEHLLRAGGEDLRLVCAFNPPLTGTEVHRADGSYAPAAD